MRFVELAEASADVGRLTGRRDKVARLAELLVHLRDDEIEPAVAFLTGTTRQGRVGIGYAAIASTFDVAPSADPTLTIGDVDRALGDIAEASGKGSVRVRSSRLADLTRQATAPEQDFLRRVLFGELRQGALSGVLTDAVARAARVPPETVRRAAMLQGDLAVAARQALREGETALAASSVQLMRPVQPMLAATGEDVALAIDALADPMLEYKLDGARVQVHKADDSVRVFSRTLNDVTASVPEIVSRVRELPVREVILDGEAIALRPDGSPHPFQITMRRFGRRREVETGQRDLPLTPYFFDVLYEDGGSLVDTPLEARVEVLRDLAESLSTPRIVRPSRAQAETFMADALARGHEGVMAKDLTSAYAAGRRGASWLKVKRAHTLDLVVLAAEWGHGRRKGWLSNLHLGARDPDHSSFVMLGKTFKGMTDEMLAWQTERLQTLAIGRDDYTIHVRPELVVEVAFNEIQESPVYPGGLALRFARVKRYRTDKNADEADTIATVRALAARTGTGASTS